MSIKKKYNPELKAEAMNEPRSRAAGYAPLFRIKLVNEQGQTLAQAGEKRGITKGTIASWVSGYTASAPGAPSGAQSYAQLTPRIAQIHEESLKTYGPRRVRDELAARDMICLLSQIFWRRDSQARLLAKYGEPTSPTSPPANGGSTLRREGFWQQGNRWLGDGGAHDEGSRP